MQANELLQNLDTILSSAAPISSSVGEIQELEKVSHDLRDRGQLGEALLLKAKVAVAYEAVGNYGFAGRNLQRIVSILKSLNLKEDRHLAELLIKAAKNYEKQSHQTTCRDPSLALTDAAHSYLKATDQFSFLNDRFNCMVAYADAVSMSRRCNLDFQRFGYSRKIISKLQMKFGDEFFDEAIGYAINNEQPR